MAIDPRLEVELPDTVKTALVKAMTQALRDARFPSANVPLPQELPDVPLFEFVDRGVLDDIRQQEVPAARCEQGDEEVRELMWPLTDKRFRFYVHFKVSKVLGVDPTPLINYYFARITETLVIPEHFANIALDVAEAGNSPQAQGVEDPEPGGSIWFDVDIRHGYGNHFSENGNHD